MIRVLDKAMLIAAAFKRSIGLIGPIGSNLPFMNKNRPRKLQYSFATQTDDHIVQVFKSHDQNIDVNCK